MFRIDIINNWYIDDEVRYNMENYANLFLFSSTLYAYYIFLRKLIFTDIILDVMHQSIETPTPQVPGKGGGK